MISFNAWRYDGRSSARRPVTLVFLADGIAISDNAELSLTYSHEEVSVAPKLSGKFRHLLFSDGSRCDVPAQEGLEDALHRLPGQGMDRFVFRLENSLVYILLALLVSAAVIYGLIQYGVPVAARLVAEQIPLEMENRMGQEALELFEHLTAPSTLSPTRQQELKARFRALSENSPVPIRQVLFRDGEGMGPNAFALPAGIILFTDQMVALAESDDELLAVYAHEVGHVQHRHSMRQLLQSSLSGLLVILLTGDIGAASSLAAALPTVLLQSKFSRDVEAEADDFAIAALSREGLSPTLLGTLLQRIEKQNGAVEIPGFLSTHPLTEDRVDKFNRAARRP